MSFDGQDGERSFTGEEEYDKASKRKELLVGKKKESKKGRYVMFEAEDSDESASILSEDIKSPNKMRKTKPFSRFSAKKKEEKKDKEKKEEKKEEKEKKKEDKESKKIKIKSKKKQQLKQQFEEQPKKGVVEKPIFGVPLAVAVERSRCHDGIELPALFRECIDYIEEHGLSCEGIYRISGVKSKVQQLKDAYNAQLPVYMEEHEPNIVASLLKQFLRELPEPVLTTSLMPKFEEASIIKNEKKRLETFYKLIEDLPECNRLLLSWTIVHMLHVIERQKENKMTLQNVSIVLSPTMQISHRVLNVLFSLAKQLFRDVELKKYKPPMKPTNSKWSLELPDSPSQLEEELAKQESLLNALHEELIGVEDPEKEEQLWEVQRVVTQLKRKIKLATKKALDAKHKEHKRTASSTSDDMGLRLELRTAPAKKHAPAPPPSKHEPEPTQVTEAVVEVVREEEVKGKVEEEESAQKQEAVSDDVNDKEPTEQRSEDVEVGAEAQKLEEEDKKDAENTPRPDEVSMVTESKNRATKDSNDASVVSGEQAIKEVEEEEEEKEEEVGGPEGGDEESDKFEQEVDDILEDVEAKPQDSSDESDQDVVTSQPEPQAVSLQQEPVVSVPIETKDKEEEQEVPEKKEEAEPEQIEESKLPDENLTITEEAEKDSSIEGAPEEKTDKQEVTLDTKKTKPKVQFLMEEKEQAGSVSESVEKRSEVTDMPKDVEREEVASEGREGVSWEKQKVRTPGKRRVKKEKKLEVIDMDITTLEEELSRQQESETETDSGTAEEGEEDEEMVSMQDELSSLILEEEELLAVESELRQKIDTERNEIERLHQEIAELHYLRQDSDAEEVTSSSDSSYDSEDEEELQDMLTNLLSDNESLERKNAELCAKIHEEKMICLGVKVQIRMIQQKQLENSLGSESMLDRELLLW